MNQELYSKASRYPHPGKFEGELNIAQYFYCCSLDGEDQFYGDCSTLGWYASALSGPFEVTDEQRKEFNLTDIDVELITKHIYGVIVYQTDQGFVSVLYAETDIEYESLCANYEQCEEDQFDECSDY